MIGFESSVVRIWNLITMLLVNLRFPFIMIWAARIPMRIANNSKRRIVIPLIGVILDFANIKDILVI